MLLPLKVGTETCSSQSANLPLNLRQRPLAGRHVLSTLTCPISCASRGGELLPLLLPAYRVRERERPDKRGRRSCRKEIGEQRGMRIRSRVWTTPNGAYRSEEAPDEGFEKKEEGRFLMPLLAAALEAERDFEAVNEIKVLGKRKTANVRGNGWRDLLLSWKDSDKENRAHFQECEIQSQGMRYLRDGLANPEKKEKEIGASTLHSVVSTLSTSSTDKHDLLSICPRRCSMKQRPKASASNSIPDVIESRKCSIDYQRSKKRGVNICDSAEKKKPKVREIEIPETDTRCKRRNGKGWRCCATRVRGYSLCEHHLSKMQVQPPKNKKKTMTKKNVLDARSGFHAPSAVDGVDNSAKEHADEYEQKEARRTEMELQVKKQRTKKKSLKDINSALDHHHPHLIRDFASEIRE